MAAAAAAAEVNGDNAKVEFTLVESTREEAFSLASLLADDKLPKAVAWSVQCVSALSFSGRVDAEVSCGRQRAGRRTDVAKDFHRLFALVGAVSYVQRKNSKEQEKEREERDNFSIDGCECSQS